MHPIQALEFAIVGHPNKGKSSIVSTLMNPLHARKD